MQTSNLQYHVRITALHKASLQVAIMTVLLLTVLLTNGMASDVQGAWLDKQVSCEAKESSFEDILEQLLPAGHKSYLVNGVPIRSTALLSKQGKLRDVLNAICEAFDLRWTTSSKGVLLFTKAFTNPADLPQSIPSELLRAARDIRIILSGTGNVLLDDMDAPLKALMSSLTGDQIASLKARNRIYFPVLSPNQRQAAYQYSLNQAFVRPRFIWNSTVKHLEVLPTSEIDLVTEAQAAPDLANVVRRPTIPSQSLFIRFPSGGDRKTQDGFAVPGNYTMMYSDAGANPYAIPAEYTQGSAVAPAEKVRLAALLDIQCTVGTGSVTVANLLGTLVNQTGGKILPARHIADRIVICKLDALKAVDAIDALNELTGFRRIVLDDGACLVSTTTARPQRQILQIAHSMQIALPRDLRDYLGFTLSVGGIARIPLPPDEVKMRGPVAVAWKHFERRASGRAVELSTDLVKRLLAIDGISIPIPNSKWPSGTKERLALTVFLDAIQATDKGLWYETLLLPAHLRDPAQMYLVVRDRGNVMLRSDNHDPVSGYTTSFGFASVPLADIERNRH